MWRSFIYTLSAGFTLSVVAQPTFERIYIGGGAGKFNLVELGSRNVLTTLSYSNSVNVTGISLIDPSGGIAHTHCYAIDTFLVIQAVKKYTDNEFSFAGGYYKDPCSTNPTGKNTYPVIGRMDSLGNVLSLHYYFLDAPHCSMIAGNLENVSDHSVIAWGKEARFYVLKADSVGELVWAKRYNRRGGFQFIKELPSGDLLAGINMDTAGAVVARLDPDGNFLWCKSYIRPKGIVHDAIIESDDSFIITGYTDSTTLNLFTPLPATFQPKLFMMKLDGAGTVQWCKGYDSAPNLWYTPQSSRIEKTLDGNYVVVATLGDSTYNFFHRPLLMKIDQNGDSLWTRSVGRFGYSHYAISLLAASDGGYLVGGSIWGDLPGNNSGLPYLFRTDSLGHLPCFERRHPVELLDLFPTDSIFTLTSVDGATVHPAFVSDTTFTPIVVYDGCTFTTGMPHLAKQSSKMKVYPNPNTGRFTVEFTDPLMAESYYSVYDAMGKLLYQRPLPPGTTLEEVDLARFGTGTYVIKCTDPDGVSYERVVVE